MESMPMFLVIVCLLKLPYCQQPISRRIKGRIVVWIPMKLLEQLDELSVIKGITS
jgi:hypothetical protein